VSTATDNDNPLLVSRDDARHQLGDISETRLWQLERNGELEVVRAGRRTFVVGESLHGYVARLRAANRPAGGGEGGAA
jgi:hypothetical protein